MKRDWSLIKRILLESEENNDPSETEPNWMNTDYVNLDYFEEHLKMLKENGYIKAFTIQRNESGEKIYWIGFLTWKGYDLLEMIKCDGIFSTLLKYGYPLTEEMFRYVEYMYAERRLPD